MYNSMVGEAQNAWNQFRVVMFWVVCYDVVDDRRRVRVMKTLEGFGRRVQYSVFECELEDSRLRRLKELLQRCINDKEDSIRFYPLNVADIKAIQLLGKATLNLVPGHHIV